MNMMVILLLMFIITLGQVQARSFSHLRSGHSGAKNVSETDSCPHLQLDPGEEIVKLRPLLLDHEERLCCACGKGQWYAGPCNASFYNSTACEDCPPNTYMDQPVHFHPQCFAVPTDLYCSDDETYFPYTATSKPECRCRRGRYRASNGTCLPHSKCGFGMGVKKPGSFNSDTVCEICGEHFESNSTSSTETCRLKESVHNHPKNQKPSSEQVTSNQTSTVTPITREIHHTTASTEKTDYKPWCYAGGSIIGIVIFGVLIYLLKKISCHKRCAKKKITRHPSERDDNVFSSNVKNQKQTVLLQSERLLNAENRNDSAQTEEGRKRNSLLKTFQRMRTKSNEIIRVDSRLNSCRRSSRTDGDRDEPTSSHTTLTPTDPTPEESFPSAVASETSESSHEGDEEQTEMEIERERQQKVLEYFDEISNSTKYSFLHSDVDFIKNNQEICVELKESDSPGVQMYQIVKVGFEQKKLTVDKLIQRFQDKNLNLIVEELQVVSQVVGTQC